MPIFILAFYCRKFKRLGDKDFQDKYGSAIDSLKTDRRSIMFFPVFFLCRRGLFIFLAFELSDERSSLFIFLLMAMTMVEAIYLFTAVPFETPLLQNLEVFNEITSMILLYTSLGFTDFVPEDDVETTINLSWVFNSVMAINICVHLYFMLRSTCQDVKKKCRERKAKKKLQEW